MKANFSFHPERCVGCGACVMACIDENAIDVDVQDPYRLRRKNEYGEGVGAEIVYFVHGCMHCPEHPCVARCPKGCFSLEPEHGTVQLDNANCIGCRLCQRVCPYDALQFRAQGRALKCNGCLERLREDRLPLCVMACPRQALTLQEDDESVSQGLAALRRELDHYHQTSGNT